MNLINKYFPYILLALYLVEFTYLAINPLAGRYNFDRVGHYLY